MGTNSMHVAKTGLNAQQRRMQVIANNLANVNTTGFKRERVNFETLLYQVLRSSGEQTSAETNLSSAFAVGTGTRIVNSDKLYSQGNIVSTDNALDLSIDGGKVWNDKVLDISWPLKVSEISERDKNLPFLEENEINL